MPHLFIDLETFSSVPISNGLYKYAESTDFQILLFAYSLNGAEVEVLDLASGDKIPLWLEQALFNEYHTKHAYNAAFEWYCLSRHFGRYLPLEHWRDTQLHALYCGYPAKLEETSKLLVSEDKQKLTIGKALIRVFSIPCEPKNSNGFRTRTHPAHEPEKWQLFKEYNKRDVEAEMAIYEALSPWQVPLFVQQQWVVDIIQAVRGVGVDMPLVLGAIACSDRHNLALTQEAVQLTGLDNPNSVAQLKEWLNDNCEDEISTLNKEDISGLLSTADGITKRVLEIRQELSKSSVKKYTSITNAVGADNRVRGIVQFYGANRTGRWAGRIVQLQNLPRTYLSHLDLGRLLVKQQDINALIIMYGGVANTLSQLVRTAFVPSAGNVYIDADFSAIEARVIAWLAKEQWVLDVFKTHGKIYEATASQMFNVPLEKISKGNAEYELRQRGKVATLALGYQGGVNALTKMDTAKALTDDEKPILVQKWRNANPNIKQLWYDVDKAAIDTVKTGRPNVVSYVTFRLEASNNLSFLTVELPSGRKLFYVQPQIVTNRFGKDAVAYYGMHQEKHKWMLQDTYGGKLVENITQAVARDCLAENIMRLENEGFPIVFHVHDEVIIEVPKDRANLDYVCEIMSRPLSWAPDLPLKAEGWIGNYFKKD